MRLRVRAGACVCACACACAAQRSRAAAAPHRRRTVHEQLRRARPLGRVPLEAAREEVAAEGGHVLRERRQLRRAGDGVHGGDGAVMAELGPGRQARRHLDHGAADAPACRRAARRRSEARGEGEGAREARRGKGRAARMRKNECATPFRAMPCRASTISAPRHLGAERVPRLPTGRALSLAHSPSHSLSPPLTRCPPCASRASCAAR